MPMLQHSDSANCYLVLKKFNVRRESVLCTFSRISEVVFSREKPKMFYYCFTFILDLENRLGYKRKNPLIIKGFRCSGDGS